MYENNRIENKIFNYFKKYIEICKFNFIIDLSRFGKLLQFKILIVIYTVADN